MRKIIVAIVGLAVLLPVGGAALADPLPPGEYAKRIRDKRKKKAAETPAPKEGDKAKGSEGASGAKPDDKAGAKPAPKS